MILIYSKRLVNILSFGNAQAITLFPFIIFNTKQVAPFVVNHEKIHLKQQLELLIIPFYLWYALEFCYHFLKVKNRHKAYMLISFEQEAYANHFNFDYLRKRKLFSHLNYLNKPKERG